MFDYKKFKKEMTKLGHEVHKKGKYIDISPNNLLKNFRTAEEVIDGYEDYLSLVNWQHCNTWIYSMRFKIV